MRLLAAVWPPVWRSRGGARCPGGPWICSGRGRGQAGRDEGPACDLGALLPVLIETLLSAGHSALWIRLAAPVRSRGVWTVHLCELISEALRAELTTCLTSGHALLSAGLWAPAGAPSLPSLPSERQHGSPEPGGPPPPAVWLRARADPEVS